MERERFENVHIRNGKAMHKTIEECQKKLDNLYIT
jgi:hypothetical protein